MSENESAHDGGEHTEHIHLPPNSFVPINLSLALAITFVGFLVSPIMWGLGLVYVVGTLVQWFRAARNEYLELPESLD